MSAWLDALKADEELAKFGKNALLLHALRLKFRVEDLETVAADALTDGNDDKKCDLVHVDPDEGVAVVAQGYMAQSDEGQSAPANKAADLNTAVAWLLGPALEELPDRIRPSAERLREALRDGDIRAIHIWYVHNLAESDNVKNELNTAATTAKNVIKALLSGSDIDPDTVELSPTEVGKRTLEEWYQTAQTPILVTQDLQVEVPGGYEIREADWAAYVTTVPARWLYDLYQEYKMDLFSANVRGYLGSRNSDRNINNSMRQTADSDPRHFWTYNNGITAIVHEFQAPSGRRKKKILQIKGLSVVNGAQTTGAIGSLSKPPAKDAFVPARFVRCTTPATIRSIIRFNNSQNRVTAPDFRSNDAIQQRLRTQFLKIPSASYLGGRRGGFEPDPAKKPQGLIPSETAAQVLAAFHQDPALAYNEKSQLWESNSVYARFFNEKTTAAHIVFCYSLVRCIDGRKRALFEKEAGGDALTDSEHKQLAFLRKRGGTFLLTSAIAKCLEVILGRSIADPFRLSFGERVGPDKAEKFWDSIVLSTMPFADHLNPAIGFYLKRNDRIPEVLNTFRSLVEATKSPNQPIFSEFTRRVVYA